MTKRIKRQEEDDKEVKDEEVRKDKGKEEEEHRRESWLPAARSYFLLTRSG